jgi:uncharacterized membrane protein HdeD (DUF308 family)
VRGVAALALGAYVVSREALSGADIARAGGAYWIVDGLVTAAAARFSGALVLGRVTLLLRAALAVAAGVVMLGLPLGVLFGRWQPGSGLVWMVVAGVALAVVMLQLGAGAFDVLVWRRIRRHRPREWTWALAAAFSAVLAVVVGATLAVPVTVLGPVLGAAALFTGAGFLVGAGTLGEPRAAEAPLASRPKR